MEKNQDLINVLDNLAQPVKDAIKADYDKKVEEAKIKIEAETNKRLASEYIENEKILVDGIEALVKETISEIVEEIQQDTDEELKELHNKKTELDNAIKDEEEFIKSTLDGEIDSLKESQKKFDEDLDEFEEIIEEAVKSSVKEKIQELNEAKENYIKARSEIIKEGKETINKYKVDFLQTATKKAENLIFETLKEEIDSFETSIEKAQKNDFASRIFEQFAPEFKTFFLNENEEMKKLSEKVEAQEKILSENAKKIEEQDKIIKESQEKFSKEKETLTREAIINESCGGLSLAKKKLLTEMVQDIPTEKLKDSIQKYIPLVLKNTVSKKIVNENTSPLLKSVSGNNEVKTIETKKVERNAEEEFIDKMLYVKF